MSVLSHPIWAIDSSKVDLPDSVLSALDDQGYPADPDLFESVNYLPNNAMIPGFFEALLLVLSPEKPDASYAKVEIVTCTNTTYTITNKYSADGLEIGLDLSSGITCCI